MPPSISLHYLSIRLGRVGRESHYILPRMNESAVQGLAEEFKLSKGMNREIEVGHESTAQSPFWLSNRF